MKKDQQYQWVEVLDSELGASSCELQVCDLAIEGPHSKFGDDAYTLAQLSGSFVQLLSVMADLTDQAARLVAGDVVYSSEIVRRIRRGCQHPRSHSLLCQSLGRASMVHAR